MSGKFDESTLRNPYPYFLNRLVETYLTPEQTAKIAQDFSMQVSNSQDFDSIRPSDVTYILTQETLAKLLRVQYVKGKLLNRNFVHEYESKVLSRLSADDQKKWAQLFVEEYFSNKKIKTRSSFLW